MLNRTDRYNLPFRQLLFLEEGTIGVVIFWQLFFRGGISGDPYALRGALRSTLFRLTEASRWKPRLASSLPVAGTSILLPGIGGSKQPRHLFRKDRQQRRFVASLDLFPSHNRDERRFRCACR